MKIGTILIGLIIAAALIIGLIYLYYYYEKPLQETKVVFRSAHIKIIDSETGKSLVCNYTLGLGSKENVYRNGTSSKIDYVGEKLPENSTFYVVSRINDASYYNDVSDPINTFNPGPFRVDLNLVKRGNLTINYGGDFGNSNNFYLNLIKEGELRDLRMCFRYSVHLIALYNNNSLTEFTPDSNHNKYYKCYIINNFDSQQLTLGFNYLNFGEIDNKDFISFIFYDTDVSNGIHKEFYHNVTKTI